MTLFNGYPSYLGMSNLQRLPDFAFLRPTGGRAEAFLEEWLTSTTGNSVHHKFLYANYAIPGFVPPPLSTATADSIAGGLAIPFQQAPKAHSFRLNLAVLGPNAAGWVLGSDSPDSPEAKFVACTQAKAASAKIAAVHARFSFNEYGVLNVTPATGDGFVVVSSEGEKQICGIPYALVEHTTLLKFGECSYVFSYTPQVRSPFYLSALCRYMELTRGSFELPSPVADLCAAGTISLSGYAMDKNALGPASGVVHAGLEKATGTPVDVMRLSRSSGNQREFATVKMLKHLKKISASPPSIVRLRDIVDEHSPVQVMAILEPLLTANLDDAIEMQSLSERDSFIVFQQCLDGVAWLHNSGIMHRSLSPATIALRSTPSVEAYIHDFGYARVATLCRAHDVPPTCYLAPEMLHLNVEPKARPYDCNVDLWALGMIALALLNQRLWSDCDIEKQDRTFYPDMNIMLSRLDHVASEVADTVHFLLRPEPHDRLPAWLAADSMRNYIAQFTPRVDDLVAKTKSLEVGEAACRALEQSAAGGEEDIVVDDDDDDDWIADDEWVQCDDIVPNMAV